MALAERTRGVAIRVADARNINSHVERFRRLKMCDLGPDIAHG